MQINISGRAAAETPNLRRYAEYRFFAAVARYSQFVRFVDIEFGQPSQDSPFLCAFRIGLDEGGSIAGEAVGPYPTSTVDAAADRAAALLAQEVTRPVPP